MNIPVLVEALPSLGDSLGSKACACANSLDPALFSGMMSLFGSSVLFLASTPSRCEQVRLQRQGSVARALLQGY